MSGAADAIDPSSWSKRVARASVDEGLIHQRPELSAKRILAVGHELRQQHGDDLFLWVDPEHSASRPAPVERAVRAYLASPRCVAGTPNPRPNPSPIDWSALQRTDSSGGR